MPLTLEQAITLDAVHQSNRTTRDGRCAVWRRNGATQLWKRDPTRYRLPLKHGLYAYDAVTDQTDQLVHAPEDCPQYTPEHRESERLARLQHSQYDAAHARFDAYSHNGMMYYDTTTHVWRFADTQCIAYGNNGNGYTDIR